VTKFRTLDEKILHVDHCITQQLKSEKTTKNSVFNIKMKTLIIKFEFKLVRNSNVCKN